MGESRPIRAFVFTGYGAFQTPEPAMAAHLDEGVSLCNMEQPEVIIATGGCSRMKTMPGRSEARSMLEYIEPRLTYKPTIISEESSLTTLDNIRNSDTQLRVQGYDPRNMLVTFWCDPTRKPTINLIGKPIFGNALRVRTGSVKVVDDSPVMNLIARVVTWVASKNSFINDHFRASRQKHFAGS